MKRTTLILALALTGTTLFAQKKTSTSATILFDATTSKDALPKAENKTVVAAIDPKSGMVAFEAVIKSFTFTNPTIQEHFNGESWLNSDQFPTAFFKGKLTNLSSINFKKDGTYTAEVEGELTLHGKTQPVKSTGLLVVNGKTITATSEFVIKLADYGIAGGAITAGKVSSEPKITVTAELK
jgi:polyisoprenoid-binding protein YceI